MFTYILGTADFNIDINIYGFYDIALFESNHEIKRNLLERHLNIKKKYFTPHIFMIHSLQNNSDGRSIRFGQVKTK